MTGGQVDHYAVLGVPRSASAPDIRRAYRRVARRHHPDLNSDPGAPERFAAAASAYEVLSDPVARARYDERLLPNPVPISRSSSRSSRSPTGIARRGVLELTASEAADLARGPLVLTDTHGNWMVIPRGTRHGDQIVLRDDDRLIALRVQVDPKT
jgi:curved DNA-binding protein CbpA